MTTQPTVAQRNRAAVRTRVQFNLEQKIPSNLERFSMTPRRYAIARDDGAFVAKMNYLKLEIEFLKEEANLPTNDDARNLRCQQMLEVATHRIEFTESGRRYLRRVSEEIVSDDVLKARAEHFLGDEFLHESENASTCALITEIECVEASLASIKSNVKYFTDKLNRADDQVRRRRCQQLLDYNLAKVKLVEGILQHLRDLK